MTSPQDPNQRPDTQADENATRESHTESEPKQAAHSTAKKKTLLKHRYFWPVFAIICLLIVVGIALNIDNISKVVSGFMSILSPVIIGCVVAYLCNPILKFYEFTVFRRMKKSNARRGLSLTLTFITAAVLVLAIALMIIPQVVDSLLDLWNHRTEYIQRMSDFLSGIIYSNEKLAQTIQSLIARLEDSGQDDAAHLIEDYIKPEKLTELITKAFTYLMKDIFHADELGEGGSLVTGVFNTLLSGAITTLNVIKDVVLGLFIAVYLLASKEKRIAQCKKFCKAMFSDKQNEAIHEFAEIANHRFGGFVYGSIIDAVVVSVMTFLILTIFEVSPYNLLIASIVGVTNVIPVFGPFIGAIPSFFIVLISNPSKAILFLILILVIQQVDGNIIVPKILGDNTGVSSLSILVAITVASGLWGIPGMVIGVPIIAVIIEIVKRFLEKRLAAKGEPTSTTEYYPADAVGDAERDVYYEHSGLLYRYEHSRVKPWFERLLAKFYRRPYEPDQPEADKTSTEENQTDDNGNNP